MKKITLQIICLLFMAFSYGQTYTSGLFDIENAFNPGVAVMNGQIDINTTSNMVTVTMIAPDNVWLALSFDTTTMIDGKDVLLFDGTDISDRYHGAPGDTPGDSAINQEPSIDTTQDWTLDSNTTSGGMRTIVATRARDTGDSRDYVFSATPTNLNVVGAHGFDNTIAYHGQNRGQSRPSFSLLSVNQVNDIQFAMTPNPASTDLNIVMPSHLQKANVEVFDVLGKKIYSGAMNSHVSKINVSNWNSGVYLVKVSNDSSTQTKRFIKQ